MSDAGVPEGWVRKVCQRKRGRSVGRCDVYIYSPQGRRFRSRKELAAYLKESGSALPISEFNFSTPKDVICGPGSAGRASPTCPPGDRETLPRGEPSPSAGDKASTSGESAMSAGVSVPPVPFEVVSEEATARPNEEPTTARPNEEPTTATPLGEDPHTREEAGGTHVNAADKPDPASSSDDKLSSLFTKFERDPAAKIGSTETQQPETKDESRPGPSLVDKKEPFKGSSELEAKPTGEEKHNSEPKEQPGVALERNLTGGAQSNLHWVDEAPSTSGQSPVDKELKPALKRKISEDGDKLLMELGLIKRGAKPQGEQEELP